MLACWWSAASASWSRGTPGCWSGSETPSKFYCECDVSKSRNGPPVSLETLCWRAKTPKWTPAKNLLKRERDRRNVFAFCRVCSSRFVWAQYPRSPFLCHLLFCSFISRWVQTCGNLPGKFLIRFLQSAVCSEISWAGCQFGHSTFYVV